MSFVILDRDGVINYDSDEYIKSPNEWHPIPGSLDAIARFNRAGFQVLVATNQSGIARGHYDMAIMDMIHEKLMHELAVVGGFIDEIFFCPHHPDDGCECRKPKPGLLYQIEKKYELMLSETFFIGDSFSDVKAAQMAGCLPLLVLTGHGQAAIKNHPELIHVPACIDLAEAVDYVLSHQGKGHVP